ncbi:MAG: aldehyde dehydrogenase family protein [Candidatus Nanopelagicales bacterium]|nr:aldehyde dehydrogenase family protein [Candidatus Nanopelagicales bacterium]
MAVVKDTFESRSPADDRVLATFPVMNAEQVDEVVDFARIAARWWSDLGWAERRKRLLRFNAIMATRLDELAELVHEENGKPTDDARLEIILAIEHTNWAAKNAERVLRRRRVMPGLLTLNQDARISYEPLGVVGVIGPWNYPVFTPIGSISYALAAGNAVVLKPSEFTPAIGSWLVDAFGEAVPEQPVLQLITGFGETGESLCRSHVDKISFTGSTPTGKRVMATCAETLTPVLLECGGKDAALVDHDADLELAADVIAFGAFSNGGQTCVGVERVYVHERVFNEFVAKLAAKAMALAPGVETDASYGPMTMPSQINVVRDHVRDAIERGANAVIGGLDSIGNRLIGPVILTNVPEDCSEIQDETFGPTVAVNPVRDLDEAVDRANASPFGLSASVFSSSRAALENAAARLEVGMVSMNSWAMSAGVSALPWGGVGQSGFGRLHGADGLREFARTKSTVREWFPIPVDLTTFKRSPRTAEVLGTIVKILYGRA